MKRLTRIFDVKGFLFTSLSGATIVGLLMAASLLTTRQAQTSGDTVPVPSTPSNGASDSFARVDHAHDLSHTGCPAPGVWVWEGTYWSCVSPGEAALPACSSGEYIVRRGLGWYCEGALPRPWLCAEGKYLRVADGGWECEEGYRSIGASTPLDIVGANPSTSATPIVQLNRCGLGLRWRTDDAGTWYCAPSVDQVVAGNGIQVEQVIDNYSHPEVRLYPCPAGQVLVSIPPDAGGPLRNVYVCQDVVNQLNLTAPLQNTNLTSQNTGALTIELAPCDEGWTLVQGLLGWECKPGEAYQWVGLNPGEFPQYRGDAGTPWLGRNLTTLALSTPLDSCPEGTTLVKRPNDSTADAGNVWACAAQPTVYNSIYSPVLLSVDLNRATGQETIATGLRSCGEGEHLSTTMVNDAGVWYCVKDYMAPTECGPGEVRVPRDAGVATCVRAPNPEDPPYVNFNTRFVWLSGPTINTNLLNLWDVGLKSEVAVKFRHYLSGGTWYVEIYWAPASAPTTWTSVGSTALSSSVVTTIPLCPKNANLCSMTYVVSAHLFTSDKDGTTYTIYAQPTWNTYARMLPICDVPGQYMVWSTTQQRLICQAGVPETALENSSGATASLMWNSVAQDWQMASVVPAATAADTATALQDTPSPCSVATQCANGVSVYGDATGCFTPAPVGASYWTGASDTMLTAEKNLGALGTGLVINTSGTPSILSGQSCTNQFVRSYTASGTATCNAVNLSTDTAATALPTTKGGTGLTTTTAGSILVGASSNTISQAFGEQAQAWMGSANGSTGSFQETILRTTLNSSWSNATTNNTTVFTFTLGKSGYHHFECTLPVLCTSTACPVLSFGYGSYDSTGYFTFRSHRTASTPNWDHVALNTNMTACTSGCYTSWTNWHMEGSLYTSNSDTVYLYGSSATAGQTVTVYYGATCIWN